MEVGGSADQDRWDHERRTALGATLRDLFAESGLSQREFRVRGEQLHSEGVGFSKGYVSDLVRHGGKPNLEWCRVAEQVFSAAIKRPVDGELADIWYPPLPEDEEALPAPPPTEADASAGDGDGAAPPEPRSVWIPALAAAAVVALVAIALWRWGASDTVPAGAAHSDLDVTAYCQAEHGARSASSTNGVWSCNTPDGPRELTTADLGQACTLQYGLPAEAVPGLETDQTLCSFGALRTPDGECALAVGVGANAGAPRAWEDALRATHDEEGGAATLGCPLGPVQRWASGFLQEFSVDGTRAKIAAIVASSPSRAVAIPAEPWEAFRAIRAWADFLFGFPASAPYQTAYGWAVDLTEGGALVSASERGAYFGVPGFVLDAWLESGGPDGCLGYPVAHGVVEQGEAGLVATQRYERGYVAWDFGSGLQLVADERECG